MVITRSLAFLSSSPLFVYLFLLFTLALRSRYSSKSVLSWSVSTNLHYMPVISELTSLAVTFLPSSCISSYLLDSSSNIKRFFSLFPVQHIRSIFDSSLAIITPPTHKPEWKPSYVRFISELSFKSNPLVLTPSLLPLSRRLSPLV